MNHPFFKSRRRSLAASKTLFCLSPEYDLPFHFATSFPLNASRSSSSCSASILDTSETSLSTSSSEVSRSALDAAAAGPTDLTGPFAYCSSPPVLDGGSISFFHVLQILEKRV